MTLLDSLNDPLFPNRYTRESGWVRVLPMPGRPLQSAELIEIQSILQNNLKAGMDSLFANGSILSGLRVGITTRTETLLTLVVGSGQIYIDGLVTDVPSSTLEVPSEGTHTIGIAVNQDVVTEEDDISLRNPLLGNSLYGSPGAARLVWNPQVVLNDASAYTIAKVVDGNLIQKEVATVSGVEDRLARYLYERSGHFCVRGLNISVSSSTPSTNTELTDLTQAESQARAAAQSSLQSAIEANNVVEALKTELTNSLRSNPANSLVIAQLRSDIQEAEEVANKLNREAVSKQTALTNSSLAVRNANRLLAGTVTLSISPGLAYVSGYRVEKTTPTFLQILKDLPTQLVESATFIYLGRRAVHERTFIDTSIESYEEAKEDGYKIDFVFRNIRNLTTGLSLPRVEVRFNLSDLAATTTAEFLQAVVDELNKLPSSAITTGVNLLAYSATGSLVSTYSQTELREFIRSNFYIQTVNNKLIFTSVSAESWVNSIEIEVRILNAANASDFTYLTTITGSVSLTGAQIDSSFQLGFRPVAEISSVVAEIEGRPLIVRGNVTSLIDQQAIRLANLTPALTDVLGDDTVIEVIEVYDSSQRTYLPVVNGSGDYELVNGRFLTWRSPNRPDDGATYYVRFTYQQPLVKDIDYLLDKTTDSIQFLLTGKKPAVGKRFTVDYSYFLARAGVITLNRDSEISYQLGEASNNPQAPTISTDLLPLAIFKMSGIETTIETLDCRALTYSDLFSLAQQVKRNTENLELLRAEIRAYEKAILARGTRTVSGSASDPLMNISRLDVESSDFTASISVFSQSITGGYRYADIPLRYISGGRSYTSHTVVTHITMPFTERVLLSQSRRTSSVDLNPVGSFKRRGTLQAFPSLVFLNRNANTFNPCDALAAQTSYYTRVSDARPAVIEEVASRLQNTFISAGEEVIEGIIQGEAVPQFNEGVLKDISHSAEVGLEQIYLKVEGVPASTGGFRVYLDGSLIRATPRNGTPIDSLTNGGILHTYRSKTDGSLELSFVLPEELGFGSHTVEVIGEVDSDTHSYCKTNISVYNNLLNQIVLGAIRNWGLPRSNEKASFELPLQTIDITDEPSVSVVRSLDTVNSIPTIEKTAATLSQNFPLAYGGLVQTFSLPADTFISSIQVRLKSIAVSGSITLQLRNTLNQLPGKTVFGIARASVYDPSTDGADLTTFTFDRPVLIQKDTLYSLSFETGVEGFEFFVGEVGIPDVVNESLVGDQLLLQGELFYSEDGLSYSELVNKDLSYLIRAPQFSTTEQVINLGEYGVVDVGFNGISAFCLNTREVIPEGTLVSYEYSVTGTEAGDEATAYLPFESNEVVCLAEFVSSLRIRARIDTSSNSLSPVLLIEGSTVSLYTSASFYENETYVALSKKYIFNPYIRAALSFDYLIPQDCLIRVFFMGGNVVNEAEVWDSTWSEMGLLPNSEKVVDGGLGIRQAIYTATTSTPKTLLKYRLELTTNEVGQQPLIRNIDVFTYLQS